jgi:hypothetical protein
MTEQLMIEIERPEGSAATELLFVEIGTIFAEGPPRDQHGKEVPTCSRIEPLEELAWPAPSYPQFHRKKVVGDAT